ncbi:endosome-associated-trafficking regulator 1 [Carcharodon carcharias]|uniref:endosome-associated-trafficking regulator 1 n=1 Tax=Carcharodon carcharias TaxID=13397 RepID=UPI001B7F75A0|nr:endosome-associated-trafficking regulator 1 [Carcharodon carcharias]
MSTRGLQGVKEEGADETNPFSFKEFVKIKSQSTVKEKVVKNQTHQQLKNSAGIPLAGVATAPKELSLSLDFPKRYFPDPTTHSPSLEEEDDDWSETYQPAVIEAAHEFSFSDSLCDVSYMPLTLSPTELPRQDSVQFTPSEWLLDEEEEEGAEKDCILGEKTSQFGPPCDEPDPPRDHFDLVGQVLYQSQLLTNEKLQEENAKLRRQNKEAKQLVKTHVQRTKRLEEELERRKVKEEKETRALESMVQQVEENLQLMTKRAVKAENTVTKMKQEFVLLQAELQQWKSENERLRSEDSIALNSAKSNALLASDYLLKAAQGAESSIRQLLSGAETLRLVSELLRSIDRISELPAQHKGEAHS